MVLACIHTLWAHYLLRKFVFAQRPDNHLDAHGLATDGILLAALTMWLASFLFSCLIAFVLRIF
jgi:hypothetical protein